MQYYSTNNLSQRVNFKEATIQGQAPDKGLYFPETIPQFPKEIIDNITNYSNEEIAFQIIRPYVGDTIPELVLRQIVKETISFEIPLIQVTEDIFSLELYHGPTLAFKDIGARFMSRCMGYFVRNRLICQSTTVRAVRVVPPCEHPQTTRSHRVPGVTVLHLRLACPTRIAHDKNGPGPCQTPCR